MEKGDHCGWGVLGARPCLMLADLKDRSSFVKWNNDNHREDLKDMEKTSL